MEKEKLWAYCIAKKNVEHEYKEAWEARVAKIGGKLFAYMGEDAKGEAILTLKCDPLQGELLRAQYTDVVAGYYMNKTHWISVYYNRGNIGDELLYEWIRQSYQLVFAGLPLKKRRELA